MPNSDQVEETSSAIHQPRIYEAGQRLEILKQLSRAIHDRQADERRLRQEADQHKRLGEALEEEAALTERLAEFQSNSKKKGDPAAGDETPKKSDSIRKKSIQELQKAAEARRQAEEAAEQWKNSFKEYRNIFRPSAAELSKA